MILKSLPGWVAPEPKEDPFKTADFGPAANAPQPDMTPPEPVKRRKKATETTDEPQT